MTGLLSRHELRGLYPGRCPVYRCGRPAGTNPEGCSFCQWLSAYFTHKQTHDSQLPSTQDSECEHCVDGDGLIRRQAAVLADVSRWREDWGSIPSTAVMSAARELLIGLGWAWSEGLSITGDRSGGVALVSLLDEPGGLFLEVEPDGSVLVVSPAPGEDGVRFGDAATALAFVRPRLVGAPPLLYGARRKTGVMGV